MVNNRIYIGQTVQPSKRWYRHRCDAANPAYPIHFAIKKYGAHNFTFEVLSCSKTQADTDYTEEQLIKQFGSLIPNGYNVHKGGNQPITTRPNKTSFKPGQRASVETEFKKGTLSYPESSIQRGQHISPETEFQPGLTPWNKGKHGYMSEEQLAMCASCKGKTWKLVDGKRVWQEV